MSYLQKLLIFSLLSSSVVGVSKSVSTLNPFVLFKTEELESIFKKTKISTVPKLSSSIDKNSISNPIYSLYSSNLITFSDSFLNHFYKWALYSWADSFLNETLSSSFVKKKIDIFNALVSTKNKYLFSDNPSSWTQNNYIIYHSELENLFLELFFKQLHIKEKKEFKIDDLSKYGDTRYASFIPEFQKFVFEKFLEYEKPFFICAKEFSYSEGKTYGQEELDSENLTKIKTPTCPDKKLFKLSDFLTLEDGRKIAGYLYRYHFKTLSDNKVTSITSLDDIFKKNSEYFDIRDFDISSKKGTFLRTQKGVMVLTSDKYENNLEKYIDVLELKDTLKDFFNKHKGELLGMYLSSDKASQGGIFVNKKWNPHFYNLAGSAAKFSFEHRKNKNLFEVLEKLNLAVKDLPFKKQNTKAIPIPFDRNLDETSSILKNKDDKDEWIDWIDEIKKENDGMYPDLNTYFDFLDKKKLFTESQELKKHLSLYMNSLNPRIKPEEHLTSYFFDDYILDNVFKDFLEKDKGAFISNSIINIHLLNKLDFNFFKNDLETFFNDLIKKSNLEYSDYDRDLFFSVVKNNIIEVYYGTLYESEPFEKKLSYGAWKYDTDIFKNKCSLKLDYSSDAESKEKCAGLVSLKKEYIQKLLNYFLSKFFIFQGFGYEIASPEASNYINFLNTFSWLVENQFKNFRNFVSELIPNGGFGVVAWIDNYFNKSSLESDQKKRLASEIQNTIQDKELFFKNIKKPELFGYYNSKALKTAKTPEKDNDLVSSWISAYAKMDGAYVELSGFNGLFTEKDSQNLPEAIYNSLWKDYDKSVTNNKNFLGKSSSGLAFGYKGMELDEVVNSFSTTGYLLEFLKVFLPNEYDQVATWKNKNNNASLEEIKTYLKTTVFTEKKSKEEFGKNIERFSGFIKNPNADESFYGSQPYFIPDKNDSQNGYIVFITQVNKYDLGKGFIDFVSDIGQRTLFKVISSVSTRKIYQDPAAQSCLLEKGIIL